MTRLTIREQAERNVKVRHAKWRADLRSRGAIFNDQLEAYLADELRRSLAGVDKEAAEIAVLAELYANFYKRSGRNATPEEFATIAADAKILAEGDAAMATIK